jgi:hypothetical protein
MACGTIAGLALAGAGAGTQAYAGSKETSAMNDAVSQEMARNQQYQQQGQNVFQQSLAKSTPQAAQQQIGQGQQQLAGLIQNAQAVPLSLSMPSSIGVNDQTQQAKTNMSNTAASNLGGYSNFGLQQNLKDMQAGSQLGVINQNARGWANILPAQIQQASQSQQGLMSLGQLLGMAGMVTGLSGLGAGTGVSASQSANVLGEMNGTSYLGVPIDQLTGYPLSTVPLSGW